MQEKNEKNTTILESLPVEMTQQIASYLSPHDTAQFARSSINTLFKNKRNLNINKAQYLSTCVAMGKQAEAEGAFSGTINDQAILLTRTTFHDNAHRTFHCTAYEYAYWAKDTHMCRMLEKHMDDDTKTDLLECVNRIEVNGLTYEHRGLVIEGSKHFDFSPLKNALNTFIQGWQNWHNTRDIHAAGIAFNKIGVAQCDVVAHVAQEYCRPDRAFDPCPAFDEPSLPRNLKFNNGLLGRSQQWFPSPDAKSSSLGRGYTIIKGERKSVGVKGWLWSPSTPSDVIKDLEAIKRLEEVRTADLAQSLENLKPTQLRASPGLFLC